MKKLIMLKGLPASGKSTWAKEQVKKNASYKRICKDDLRAMLHDSVFSGGRERFILKVRDALIETAFKDGYSVIVDDTNFHDKHEARLKDLAEKNGAKFSVKLFDTDLKDCIARDLKRPVSVGEKVIRDMYNKYLKPLKPYEIPEGGLDGIKTGAAFIFDIDGTLAKMVKRSPYDYTRVNEDIPVIEIIYLLRSLKKKGHFIFCLSGRPDNCRQQTEEWLAVHGVEYDQLLMREAGDQRKDWIVKKEIYERDIEPNHQVVAVFDDRDQVVEMWRNLGLVCLQVDYGDF